MKNQLSSDISQLLETQFPASLTKPEIRNELAAHINYLINHDFEKLVFLLYRIDINEVRMRHLLHQTEGENAAGLIADLIIERQLQKIESRKKYNSTQNISDDEKW